MSIFLSLWEDALVAEFGKRAKRHAVAIMHDIIIVDNRLKPSYLWDLLQPCPQKVFNFLGSLRDKNLLKTLLHVAVVGEDVFLVHPQELAEQVRKLLRDPRETFLVDVSKTLDSPVSAEASVYLLFEANLKRIAAQLASFQNDDDDDDENARTTKSKVLKFEFKNCRTISLSTVFGAFLGYPVLYYCRNDDGNCLSFCPVRKFSVALVVNDHHHGAIPETHSMNQLKHVRQHAAYTFTVPESLVKNVGRRVDEWYSSLRAKLNCTRFEFVMTQETLTPSSVLL